MAASAITSAVGSSIAKNMWEVEGACSRDKVSDTHLAQIELAIPGRTVLFGTPHGRTPRDVQKIAPSAKPARVLSTLTF
ncbi:hypothetical protein AMC79_PD00810 (plasmid) [Rhizobium phaseoli]|nr:hypothetical protein AMC89_PD00813 [Rhizobium phaseoli]ANM01975.1 hypothetical protein AMC79_PD00810 [Rhizobium phaseoli]